MSGLLALLYGMSSYAVFVFTLLYAIGFVGNFVVPKAIDSGTAAPLLQSILVDVLLLTLFAIQHSVMARPGFKALWTKIVPASLERATYVLVSSLVLLLVFWQWRAMPEVIWQASGDVARAAIWGLFALGWLVGFLSTYMIDHFDLFGLRQVMLNFRGQPYQPRPFMIRGLYRLVRHPLMLGFIIAFWAAPTMTLGHLFFAAAMSAYILVALQFEERDLLAALGDAYADYRRRVPMLIPWTKR
jgi:protein-S-isoprenylcysteine O-methyltransferase Ste14